MTQKRTWTVDGSVSHRVSREEYFYPGLHGCCGAACHAISECYFRLIVLQHRNVTQGKFYCPLVRVARPSSWGLWECGKPAFFAGFPSAEGRVGNSF